MPPSERVDARSLAALAVVLVLSSGIVFAPAPLVSFAGRDAWLAPLVAAPAGAAVAWALARTSFASGREPVAGLRRRPVLRALAGATFAAYALHLAVLVTAETVHVLLLDMPETPPAVFAGLVALAGFAVASGGRGSLARTAVMVFPVFVLTTVGNLVLALPLNAEPAELLPLLVEGPAPVLWATLPALAWMGEVVLLALWAEAVVDRPRVARHLPAAVLLVALLLAAVTGAAVAAMGPREVARSLAPVLTMARLVRVLPVLSRLETAIVAAWLLGTYVKVAVAIYAGASALRRGLGLAGAWQNRLAAVLATAAAAAALWAFPRADLLVAYLATIWPPLGVAGLLAALALAAWAAHPREHRGP